MNGDPRRWLRRAASLTLYSCLGTFTLGLFPLWLLLAGIVDGARDRRLPRVRAVAFFALYLVCELAGVAAAFGIWLTRGRGPQVVWRESNAALQRRWTSALMGGAVRIFGMRVTVEGAELAARGPFLLFVRHSSTADTVLAAALVANPHRVLLRYVLKRELLWDPCLDIVGQRLPNAFLSRTGANRGAEVAAIVALTADLGPADGVLIYPEGTRFSSSKLARAREALVDRPELAKIAAGYQHVLPPRLGGPLALLERGLDVVFLDQSGFEGSASFGAFLRGNLIGKTIAVRLRRVPAAEIPATARDRWLFEQWRETDAWVRRHA
ncbi:hypothetical protein LBMAG42_46290 [Deltaproteobacteria bacterium]|nr:hypothetical protein LBMAG42_46290 [Deltaproteobacteria bacterium]